MNDEPRPLNTAHCDLIAYSLMCSHPSHKENPSKSAIETWVLTRDTIAKELEQVVVGFKYKRFIDRSVSHVPERVIDNED